MGSFYKYVYAQHGRNLTEERDDKYCSENPIPNVISPISPQEQEKRSRQIRRAPKQHLQRDRQTDILTAGNLWINVTGKVCLRSRGQTEYKQNCQVEEDSVVANFIETSDGISSASHVRTWFYKPCFLHLSPLRLRPVEMCAI